MNQKPNLITNPALRLDLDGTPVDTVDEHSRKLKPTADWKCGLENCLFSVVGKSHNAPACSLPTDAGTLVGISNSITSRIVKGVIRRSTTTTQNPGPDT
jgi:hypothetical protein